MDCCINIAIQLTADDPVLNLTNITASGSYNGKDYFEFQIGSNCYVIYNVTNEDDTCTWIFGTIKCGEFPPPPDPTNQFATLNNGCAPCPIGRFDKTENYEDDLYLNIVECGECIKLQNRTKADYSSIKLPAIFEEEDRGFFRCCCPYTVLASSSTDTWKNDITSAWIKLSDATDTVEFILSKDGVNSAYQPTIENFVREPLGRYITIDWNDVLSSDGQGCYTLTVQFNISGVIQSFTWGIYNLLPYSIQNALKTARIRVIFNSYQEIEQLDFTDSKIEDTFRFHGFIGNAQPNTEIDNLIYENREMRKVIRENLNSYELITDPLCEEFITALKDLYLLSENELFLSDYNAHNHSYKYQDIPAIVEESPEIEYYDFSRSAKLTCKLADKYKNKRSYFK